MRDNPEALELLDEVIEMIRGTYDDTWWEGPTFRSPCGTKHCVLSHIAEHMGMDAMERFEDTWSTSYRIGADVNDQQSERYPQLHPKERVLAFLDNLRTGVEDDVQTSMWKSYMQSGFRAELMAAAE
jgi:hypothetical protein